MNNTVVSMPPLAGKVCSQFIRCGKTSCHCNHGELHGPYYYRIWREGNSVRKVYVNSLEMEAVKAACGAHRSLTGTLRDMKKMRQKLTLSIHKEWRRTQRMIEK